MRQQTGLKNEIKVSELIQSGSLAIKTKNEFGVHVFSGSVSDDGILSGKLTKPKYNEDELIKSTKIISKEKVESLLDMSVRSVSCTDAYKEDIIGYLD